MALKDLIASKASLGEDVIEEIVSDYVRFDPDHKTVFLTPESHELSNRAKVLIYLVALQGWRFVIDDAVPADAKPAEIEEHTGITGGTLRPILKELKDRKIIAGKAGRYSVLSVALRTVKAQLDGSPVATSAQRPKRKPKRPAETEGATDAQATDKTSKNKQRRSSPSINLTERFQSWIDGGYFDKPKTLSDVQQRFHKEAVIVPMTSLPKYLLRAVRSGRLERDKEDVNGKRVWVYRKAK